MKPIVRAILGLYLLGLRSTAAGIAVTAVAAFSAVTAIAVAASPRIVVLDNDNLLEGEVERTSEGYHVRGRDGGELVLPATRVRAVVADRRAAYQFLIERSNRRDPDERLRLARWCADQGLHDQAREEVEAALKLRPGFRAAEQFARVLEAIRPRSGSTGSSSGSAREEPLVTPAKADSARSDEVIDVPTIEYNSASFPLFASRVNAVLLNLCATCHARDSVAVFRLTRASGRPGVVRNLMAALPYVDPKNPSASLILAKALTPHGGAAEAPIRAKVHPAYQTLETWVRCARAPEGTPPPSSPTAEEPRLLPKLDTADPSDPSAAVAGSAQSTPPGPSRFAEGSAALPPRSETPAANDPFDPEIFNRMHRKK